MCARRPQLLYRAEVGRRLRVLLAPVGGRLSDAAPAANPHAPLFYGASRVFRLGHGLAAPEEGGCGSAISFGDGAVSGSVGHFCSQPAGAAAPPAQALVPAVAHAARACRCRQHGGVGGFEVGLHNPMPAFAIGE